MIVIYYELLIYFSQILMSVKENMVFGMNIMLI